MNFTPSVNRTDVVYGCDTCLRRIKLPSNPASLDVVRKCIITQGCDGNMFKVKNSTEQRSAKLNPPEVAGLTDWTQKRLVFNFTQRFTAARWVIEHNLQTTPVIFAYANVVVDGVVTQQEIQPQRIETIDRNTVALVFEQAYAGVAQCVSSFGQNYVNPPKQASVDESLYTQLTHNGELTLATLDTTQDIDYDTSYVSPNVTTPVRVIYTNVSQNASIDSPWVGVPYILLNGKRYVVRSFNIITTPNGPTAFDAGQIGNGSTLNFNDLSTGLGQTVILLGQSPYTAVDRIVDKYVDLALNPNPSDIVYDSGELFLLNTSRTIRKTYPYIVGTA